MKRQLAALLLTIFALSLTACGETAAESETRTVYAMDTVMNLTVYGENAAAALESAEKELHTLDEAVLSRTAEGSELYALNASNGETVECGADDILPALIETALTISDATDGAFDPTLAPVLDAWGFTKDERRVPSADELKELLSHTGCGKVALEKTADGWTVTLLDGAQLDLGGIAKGYAADLLRAQLEKEGVTSATLDLGGDVFVMGRKTDGSDWRIAVKDPADTESYLGVVSAADKFIVTSGVYERYFEENGVRYHHILDPKTGCPAESGLVSVTVLCENGAWADALSTACFVLGPDGALALRDDLADQGTDFELILVTDDADAQIQAHGAQNSAARGEDLRHQGRAAQDRMGQPDSLLRLHALSARQGHAHRLRDRQHPVRHGRRPRRLHQRVSDEVRERRTEEIIQKCAKHIFERGLQSAARTRVARTLALCKVFFVTHRSRQKMIAF